jgi:AsmA protein
MRKILIIVGGLLVLLLGALLIIPNLIPQEVYRAKIEEEASKALGRKVTVTGNIGVSIFPRLEARAGASTIANPDGFGDKPFASMKELRAAVALWPLLFQSVEIEEFVLVEPTIGLVSLEDGKNNWTFDIGGSPQPDGQQPAQGGSMGATLRDVRIEKGAVSFDDRKTKTVHALRDFDLSADMQALDKPLSFKASGLADELTFKLESRLENPKAMLDGVTSPASIKIETDLVKTSLDGTLALGAKPTFDFKFDGEIPSAVKLADAFQIKDLPARGVLNKLSLNGQAFGAFDDITLKIASAKHEGPLLNADLKGEARIAQSISLALEASAEVPQLAQLAKAMNIEAPAASALGKATATTKITGTLDDLTFNNVNFTHNSGLLNLLFNGNAELKKELTFAGNLTIAAPDLRKLAAAAGAQLPAGDVYKAFQLTGQTSGSAQDVLLKNAVLQFDDIRGTGEAALNLSAGRPRLTGALTTNAINITPYAAASGAPTEEPPPSTKGWGNTPIDLAPLRLADADLVLKTGGVTFDKFDFGPSNIVVKLAGGKLTADLKQTTLFGGAGGASFVADGSGSQPAIALKANIDNLKLKPLLSAASGFEMIDGKGGLNIDIAGSGANLQTMMSSLVGKGDFKFDEGILKGVNLQELGKAAQTALTSKSLSLGAFSANAQTNFNALNTSFAMKDGVAVLTGLTLEADGFNVSGGGALDIGKQQVQLSMFPEFKDKKAGLNGYGLPIKLAGGWDGIGLSLDWDFLKDKAVANVQAKAGSQIQNELNKLGGDLRNKFGLDGSSKPAAETQTPATPAPAPAPATPPEGGQQAQPSPQAQESPQSAQDRLKAEADKALNKLLGKDKN